MPSLITYTLKAKLTENNVDNYQHLTYTYEQESDFSHHGWLGIG